MSEIYDETVEIIQTLKSIKDEVTVTDGLVSSEVLTNLTIARNGSLIVLNTLMDLHLNLTTGDEDLAQDFIDELTDAEEMLNEFIEIVINHKTIPTTTSTEKSMFKRQILLDETFKLPFQRIGKKDKYT